MEKSRLGGRFLTAPRLPVKSASPGEAVVSARALGLRGEDLALSHLKRFGYRIVGQGYRKLRGEIDIVAYDGETLVFVEVKTRTGTEFGSPEESVTPGKQRQIRRIALAFLTERNLGDVDCRFDVVSILFDECGKWTLTHFKDAF